ncbi:hypothetical protein EV207_12555 [Scopulibacillus darangshiensis]|uniref:Uncharacterized protein n=1 Tax=Scopulibacillus darangshiensis TaxID=442528 RepID=A0A4R2NSP5_9BACL|nr:hypothetical protein [Scopulibacillus darangshiensis]TCP24494.1 hypothetical protein EV207_12555 [Scopulibacillus darangshiensis]
MSEWSYYNQVILEHGMNTIGASEDYWDIYKKAAVVCSNTDSFWGVACHPENLFDLNTRRLNHMANLKIYKVGDDEYTEYIAAENELEALRDYNLRMDDVQQPALKADVAPLETELFFEDGTAGYKRMSIKDYFKKYMMNDSHYNGPFLIGWNE